METLQRLTRRQVDTLRAIGRLESTPPGVPLMVLAGALGVRPPSALAFLTALESHGLVQRHRGKTQLTGKGRTTLLEYQRHHRLAESLFGQLGLSPEATCHAAREVDLALSHRTVDELCKAEGHPSVCPHGETISPCGDEESDHRD
jgi:Mn-dependent DtxR family transcriptional regulator